MIANQRKCRGVMVEFPSRPLRGLMARSAIPAILTFVRVLSGVTGETIFRRVLIDSSDMAGRTLGIDVRTRQFEPGRIVIEGSGFPGISRMTLFTNGTQLTHVCIVLLMARETVHGRPFKNAAHVTRFACHLHMSTGQFKQGAVMIEA